MRLVILGNKIDKTKLKQIAWIDVHENGDLSVDAIDSAVQDGVLALANAQLANGGFFLHVGQIDPTDENRHVTYAIARDSSQEHFDWALEATVATLWTGERVGRYEINGFASYVEG